MPVRRHPVAVSKHTDPLAMVPVDLALVRRLRETYDLLRGQEIRFVELFYSRLFAAAPQVRSMFRSDPDAQSRKLIAALDAVVRNLEHPAETSAMLSAMGQRHTAYGAKPEHYGLVVTLLVDSMGEVLHLQPGDARLEEWRTALRLISDQMIAAGETGGMARPGPHS